MQGGAVIIIHFQLHDDGRIHIGSADGPLTGVQRRSAILAVRDAINAELHKPSTGPTLDDSPSTGTSLNDMDTALDVATVEHDFHPSSHGVEPDE